MIVAECLTGFLERSTLVSACDHPADHVVWRAIDSMIALGRIILFLIPLTGCADERTGAPISSNLSGPTDTTGGWDADQNSRSTAADDGGEQDPVITMTATPSGITTNVSWERPPDFNVAGYSLHYAKHTQNSQSGEVMSEDADSEDFGATEPSWCSQGEHQIVAVPSVTISGLEPNTAYVFAIRAFTENESDSLCSNPIVVVTPQAET